MDFITISTSKPDQLESVGITQQAEEVTPTITANFLITEQEISDPPPSLAVTIAGVRFDGVPHQSSIKITADGKIIKSLTYVHKFFKTLTKGFGQDILFISSPKSVFDAMEHNEDFIVIKWKESDHYNCKGWSVKKIIEEVISIIRTTGETDVPIVKINIPDFDVASPTVQYQAGGDFIQFINGLLPTCGNLSFAWFFDVNGVLTITLVSTAAHFTLNTDIDAESIDFTQEYNLDDDSEYTGWRFTGGEAKPVLAEYKYIKIVPVAEKEETEVSITTQVGTTLTTTTPNGQNVVTSEPIQPTPGGIPVTTRKIIKKLYDFKGDEFHVTQQTTENRGAIYNSNGESPVEGKTSYEVILYKYDNADTLIYEKSRSLGSSKKTSGLITKLVIGINAIGYAANSKGPAYLLLDDLTIVTKKEYDSMWPEVGGVLLGSYISFEDVYSEETEAIIYVSEANSTKEEPEGSIKTNSTSKIDTCYKINATGFGVAKSSRFYACTEDGRSILQDVVQLINDTKGIISSKFPDVEAIVTLSSIDTSKQTVQIYDKEIKQITVKGTYRWKETTKELDLQTGVYNITTRDTVIPSGRIPMEPTQYRKQQLLHDEGDMGKAKMIIPFSAQIDTNNREHFKTFYELIKNKAIRPTKTIQIQGLSEPYFIGETYAGGIVTGWSINATGDGTRQISVTINV